EFEFFYREYKEGKKVRPEVVMKILQTFERIQMVFPVDSLTGIIDISLTRRAIRIFSDFLGTIQGIIPAGNPENIDLIPFIQGCITSCHSSGVSDLELMQSVDDEKLYRQTLVNRLAHHPHTLHIVYRLKIGDNTNIPVLIHADRDRFHDLFAVISEYFEGISADTVEVLVNVESDGVLIIFTPEGSDIRYEIPLSGSTQREVAYAGGRLMSVMELGKEDIRIMFSPAT
ncbi:MAG: hypothetical protein V1862_12545, partial [Methanobacteriota archaeon]